MEEVSGAGILADRGLAITDGPPAARMAVTITMSPPYKKRLQSDKRADPDYLWSANPGLARLGAGKGKEHRI